MFNAAVIINDGSQSATNTRLPKERIDTYDNDWTLKNPNMKTDIFWTGKTIFHYGDNKPSAAAPSKNRPGPHRSKREAKKEAKEQRFKPIESVVPKPAGCMTKPVNLVRYDMSSFLESCVEAYCKLAQVKPETLKKSYTPFTELGIPKPTLSEKEEPGRLQPIASKILMKILFAARMARFDLLRATQSLASRVTKWSIECDVGLHRLVSYIHHTKNQYLEGFVGDSFEECQLWLFADADFAGEHDSKSTTGVTMILVGPSTYYPLNAYSKKQTVTSMSSTEAEVVAANHGVRAEGIPTLALFEQLTLFKQAPDAAARLAAMPKQEGIFTIIDPEIDAMRNGNVDSGLKAGHINGMVAYFPEFCRVKFMEDNQATITILSTGHSQSMRHANRTQCVSFRWLKQQFECGQFELVNVKTDFQVADILTKPFTSPAKWEHALRLIGIGPSLVQSTDRSEARASAPANVLCEGIDQGGDSSKYPHRLLVEFCCSSTSKLGEQRKPAKNCKVIRVTEQEDGTSESCRRWLAQEIEAFKKVHPNGMVFFYASLPCTGGSPWTNVNKDLPNGSERIAEQQQLFGKLFKSFKRCIADASPHKPSVTFELSKNCKYWSWPSVQKFISDYKLRQHAFHGCQFGLKGLSGKPLKKGWKIATDVPQLATLDNYICSGSHVHEQSRGKSLKLAEGYTFELTDMLHGAFCSRAVELTRPKPIRAVACYPAPTMAQPERHYSEHQLEILRGWDTLFQRLLTSSIFADVGQDQGAQEMALGLAHDHTAQSVVDTWRESYECVQHILNPFIEAKRSSLAYHRPPSAVTGPVYQVLISDSTLAMVSGRKKTRQRHDLERAFHDNRCRHVLQFHHEMHWGAELRTLIKRAIICARAIRKDVPDARIYVNVVWAGNELVGENGIVSTNRYPYTEAKGDPIKIEADTKRHLTWYVEQGRKAGCNVLAVSCIPNASIYELHSIYTHFGRDIKRWFRETFAEPDVVIIDLDPLLWQMELKDQFHMTFCDKNQSRVLSWFNANFYILHLSAILSPHLHGMNEANQRNGKRDLRVLDASLSPFTPASEEYRQAVIDVIHRREENRKRIEAASRPLTVEEVRREQPDLDEYLEEDEIMELPIAVATKTDDPMNDDDAPPVMIARTAVKEESDDEEEPAPEAEAAHSVQPSPASPKAKAMPSASSAPKKESLRAGRITKEEWETMLLDSQFEETYIVNHHLSGQAEYRYTEVEDVHGKVVPGVIVDGHPYELILISGWSFEPPPRWYRLPQWLKSHLTRASGILRGNITTNDWDTQHDEDRFLDLNQFVSALFAELPEAKMKVTDLMHMGKLDNKDRFEYLAIAGYQRATAINQTYWPLKIRTASGHNNQFIRSESDLFFNADVIYVRHQDAGRDLSSFRGTGVPVMESIEDVPAMPTTARFMPQSKEYNRTAYLLAVEPGAIPAEPTYIWHGVRSARMKWCQGGDCSP